MRQPWGEDIPPLTVSGETWYNLPCWQIWNLNQKTSVRKDRKGSGEPLANHPSRRLSGKVAVF